jgi:hypothetical protein
MIFDYFAFIVFNVTFNNISVISWQSVLLVEETGGAEKSIDLKQVTVIQISYENEIHSNPILFAGPKLGKINQ